MRQNAPVPSEISWSSEVDLGKMKVIAPVWLLLLVICLTSQAKRRAAKGRSFQHIPGT